MPQPFSCLMPILLSSSTLQYTTIWDNCRRLWLVSISLHVSSWNQDFDQMTFWLELFSLPDIWSSCRDLWIQIFPGWSCGSNIRHTRAEACCWKLDSGIYNGHLTCEDASLYSIVNLGFFLERSPKNVYSLLPLGLVRERPLFLGCLLDFCFFHCKAYKDFAGRFIACSFCVI